MGGPMATHLVRDGHGVVVFGPRPEAVETAAGLGPTQPQPSGLLRT